MLTHEKELDKRHLLIEAQEVLCWPLCWFGFGNPGQLLFCHFNTPVSFLRHVSVEAPELGVSTK